MVTEYLPIPDYPHYLVTTDRQRAHENQCMGCMRDFGTRWPFGILLALVTDRSGSEQAHAHNDPECIALACERLDDGEFED